MSSTPDYSGFTVAQSLEEEFNVPLDAFRAQHAQYTHLAVGVLVFSKMHLKCKFVTKKDHRSPCVLIIQRASTDTFAELWEIPGGSSDSEDKTILHGGSRELYEETGLQASKIAKFVGKESWENRRRGVVDKFIFITEVKETWVHRLINRLAGLICRNNGNVKLNPDEHQDFKWATEEEVRDGKFEFLGQKETILKGFDIIKSPGLIS